MAPAARSRGRLRAAMNRPLLLVGIALAVGSTSCSSTLAQPFQNLKNQPITIYRLQNYEPPAAQQGAAAPGIPPQIQQWLSAGAALLPPGLLPPGLLPGGTPAPAAGQDVPRYYGFRILGTAAVTDSKQREKILELFGKGSNWRAPATTCMYAEFGFQIGQPPPPGTPIGAPGTSPPADILVSLSCNQVQMHNYSWPHGTKTAPEDKTSKEVIRIVQKAFGG
jgi:hypothetical protein